MSFTPTKYELKLTVDFEELTFKGDAKIHVDVIDAVKEFDLKTSKDLEIERVSFWQARYIQRGNPNTIGEIATIEVDKENDLVHVTLLGDIDAESIREEGYIQVEYQGKFGESDAVDGLHHSEGISYEANLNAGNVTTLLPILEDIPVPITLSVVTPYRAGVQTNLQTGDHKSVNESLFANNFTGGDEKVLASDLKIIINAPTALVLD